MIPKAYNERGHFGNFWPTSVRNDLQGQRTGLDLYSFVDEYEQGEFACVERWFQRCQRLPVAGI